MNKIIQEQINEVEYQIEKGKQEDAYTLVLKNKTSKKYILSKYAPKTDALKLIEGQIQNKQTVFILFGYMFGYVSSYILETVGEKANILIIEPNEELFKAQQQSIGENKNIAIITGTDEKVILERLSQYITLEEAYNIKFILANYYAEFYSAYYQLIMQKIIELREKLIMNHNTIALFDSLLIKNTLKNRYAISKSYDIREHKDKYRGIPAVIVSAGPSLEKNISYIKDFTGAIFTGGRSVTAVVEQGVKPDFVVSIDPQDETYYTFKENKENNFPLITVPEGNALVIEHNSGPKYFLESNMIQMYLFEQELEKVSMGGSVATLCLSMAHYMGFNPIIFIGQDFAFTDNKMHSDNCSIRYNKLDEKDKSYKKIIGYYKEEVLSDLVLVNYLRWFEEFIDMYDDREYINATEGGACIKGTIQCSFKEVVEQFKTINKAHIEHNKKIESTDYEVYIYKVLDSLEGLRENVDKGVTLSEKLLEEYDVYNGIRKNKIEKLLKSIDDLEKIIVNQYDKKDITSVIFGVTYEYINMLPDFKEKLNETKLQKDNRIVQLNLAVYRAIKKAVDNTIKVIKDNL